SSGPVPGTTDAAIVADAQSDVRTDARTDQPPADPWGGAPPAPANDQWSASRPVDGPKPAGGPGVGTGLPPQFLTRSASGITVGADSRGVMIAAAPIAISSNDPKQLAQFHARANHLVLDKLDTVFVGGVQRPMGVFHGSFGGVAIRQI